MLSINLILARTKLLGQLFKKPIKVPLWQQPPDTMYISHQKYFGSVKTSVYICQDDYGYFIKCPERIPRTQFHDIFDVNTHAEYNEIVYVPHGFRHGYCHDSKK